jgi:hypothetical protein
LKDLITYYWHEALCRVFLVLGLDLKGPPPAISRWGPWTRFQARWKNAAYRQFADTVPRDTLSCRASLYIGRKRIVITPSRRFWVGQSDFELGAANLPVDADHRELGRAVIEVLSRSQFTPDINEPRGREEASA